LLVLCVPAAAQQKPRADAAKLNPAEVTQTLNAVMEAQRTLAASVAQLRDEFTEAQRGVTGLREEMRLHQDAVQGAMDQIKGMREEVRGLYVESSGLKGDIAQVGKQVESLDQSLGTFRLSSGVVVAVVIVLQVGLVGLMFRSRG
jgi:chromosome segregation ATPase